MKQGEEEKLQNAGNPVLLLIMFGSIMAFLFFIPQVFEKYNAEKASLLGIGKTSSDIKKDNEDENHSNYFKVGETLSFGEFMYSGLAFEENIAYISVKHDGSGSATLNDKNLYLELYTGSTSNPTLIGRRALTSNEQISNTNLSQITIDITGIHVTENTFARIAYTPDSAINETVKLSNNELTCTKNSETIVYTFSKEQVLTKVNYTITGSLDTVSNYRNIKLQLDNLNGATANLEETESVFTFNAVFDYSEVKSFNVGIDNLYNNETLAKVIKFKNETKGYNC